MPPRLVRPVFVFLGLFCGALRADVTLAPLFVDHAVLQRDKPVPVWGRAEPAEPVTVKFLDQTRSTTADASGHWQVTLAALPARKTGGDLSVHGHNQLVIHDVLVGEVWLCSGQSNMEMVVNDPVFPVFRVKNADDEVRAARFPLIRQFKVDRQMGSTPQETIPPAPGKDGGLWSKEGTARTSSFVAAGNWMSCSPETAAAFGAVGYFFGREIFRQLDVPIGLINSSWGGTPIESWMPRDAIESTPSLKKIDQRWDEGVAAFPATRKAFDDYERIRLKAEAGDAEAKAYVQAHRRPPTPRGPGNPWQPTVLYNGMIHPLEPYALRGILWYQGESNADRPRDYAEPFQAMITTWRRHFQQGDLPFYWVQLAGLKAELRNEDWTFLREGQAAALRLPNTGQAVAIDIGDPRLIHPLNKQEVGRRLALIAEANVYHLHVASSGPVFDHAEPMRSNSGEMKVYFRPGYGALKAGPAPGGFELAGEDQKFHPATARIEGPAIVVKSAEVTAPVAVRYAWKNYPEDANLQNEAGLPAAPFRSDAW